MRKREESSKFLSVLLCLAFAYAVIVPDFVVAQAPRQGTTARYCNVAQDPVNRNRQLAADEEFVTTEHEQLITYDTGSHARGVKGAQPVTCILPAGIQVAVKKDTRIAQWDRPSGNQIFSPTNWVPVPRPQAEKTPPPPRDENVNLNVTGIPQRIEVDVTGTVTHKVEGAVKLEPTEPLSKMYKGQVPPQEKTADKTDKKSWCGKGCKITLAVLGIGAGIGAGLGLRGGGEKTVIQVVRGYQPIPPPQVRVGQSSIAFGGFVR